TKSRSVHDSLERRLRASIVSHADDLPPAARESRLPPSRPLVRPLAREATVAPAQWCLRKDGAIPERAIRADLRVAPGPVAIARHRWRATRSSRLPLSFLTKD